MGCGMRCIRCGLLVIKECKSVGFLDYQSTVKNVGCGLVEVKKVKKVKKVKGGRRSYLHKACSTE